MRDQMAAGKTLEEIRKAGLPDEWKTWNWNFIGTEKWIETIYRSSAAH